MASLTAFKMALALLALIVAHTVLLCYVVYHAYFHPLRDIPGPPLSRFSKLYLLGSFLRGEQHLEQMRLHDKYGPIVRIAPNFVIINDPAYFQMYFNWNKAKFWRAFRADPVHINHASEEDTELHKAKKKLVMPAYQMSAVAKNEFKIDKHISTLTRRLKERTGKVMDFVPWTQYAAFDIVMDMVFSNPPGFLENASDVNRLIESIYNLFTVANIPAIFPFLARLIQHPLLFPYIAPKPTDPSGPGYIHGLAYKQVRNRLKNLEDSNLRFSDVLQGIIDKSGNENMATEMLEQESVSPILAGSDSVGAHIRAVVLYVATTPRVLAKLRREIDEADEQDLLSDIPQYDEIKKHLPYVDLIHKEALRIYPIVGGSLPREVPKGGAMVCGHFLPGGTDVGVNQWVVSRDPKIWGPDYKIFRPERWEDPNPEPLSDTETNDNHNRGEGANAARTARALRESGNIFFSSGYTMCTGRHIALLEIYKMITQLFREFDIQIVDPTKPWKQVNKLGMLQWDFWVVLTKRENSTRREKEMASS